MRPGAQTGLPGFLPELRGPSISGRVTDSSGMAQPFVPVYFSLLGEQRDFIAGMSDAEGRFALPLPAHGGRQEMIVVPGPAEGQALVRIDQDFEQERYPMPLGTFTLTDHERALGALLARRRQLQDLFLQPAEALTEALEPTEPFYGTPSTRVELGDYVDLPTLEEVLVNLVPDVFVLKRRGRRLLSFQGGHSAMEVYAPLLMIDFIPVFDQERLMDLDPQKLSRIDLVNEVYVRGGHSFGGLMNIISRKGDMAGFELSPGSYFFDYPGLWEASGVREQAQTGDRVPETRNTLLWMDRVCIRPGSALELQSELPSQGGNYVLVFRARGPRGEVFCSSVRIRSLRARP